MKSEDIIIKSLLDLHEKVDSHGNILRDLQTFRVNATDTLDTQTAMLRRLDEERYVSGHRVDRLEGDVAGLKSHTGYSGG